MLKSIFITNLRKLLQSRGLKQTDIAKGLDVHDSTVSNWLWGRTFPPPEHLEKIAAFFDVKVEKLFTEGSSFEKTISVIEALNTIIEVMGFEGTVKPKKKED